jgi:hypothetical protein
VRVIRTALEVAPISPDVQTLAAALEPLHVVSGCSCGCDSVDFVRADDAENAKPLADGTAETERGGKVGIIVWGTASRVTGLEIYYLGAGDGDLKFRFRLRFAAGR